MTEPTKKPINDPDDVVEEMIDGIVGAIIMLPAQLRRSLTWDQGAETARHAELKADHSLPVYFCDPNSPWQRGTNENTDGLLRRDFPKGTDLAAHGPDGLDAVAAAHNGRPRKTLGWRTPGEALDEPVSEEQDASVATIG
jgi:IS30 family transposase